MSTEQQLARIGGAAAVIGSVVLFIATMLHPMSADPNDPPAAFAEYAADARWVGSHLGQFFGIALLGVALVAVASTLEPGTAAAWGRVGVFGATASVATTAALQAVDGVALKVMVDRWSHAAGDDRLRAFEGAVAVRQIEIGMASLVSLTFGLTIVVYGIAMLRSARYSAWLAWLGLAGGAATVAAGIAQASTGFSSLSMILSMPASVVLLVWALTVGAVMWRNARSL